MFCSQNSMVIHLHFRNSTDLDSKIPIYMSTPFPYTLSCADPEIFVSFLIDKGRTEDTYDTKSGPSSAPPADDGQNIKCWLGNFVILGDPDQYC